AARGFKADCCSFMRVFSGVFEPKARPCDSNALYWQLLGWELQGWKPTQLQLSLLGVEGVA
ncbi:unnamed protein product, partial [Chrysoparadoxa australica]